MKITKANQYKLISGLIVFGIILRLIPHPANFTPIGAIGLFAGSFLTLKRFWLVPIIGLLLSDLYLGFYNVASMLCVYFSFIISAFIGKILLSHKNTPNRVGLAAVVSAIQFFIISNFGVWLSGTIYSFDIEGLIQCYVMAIPFFGNTLVSELFYSFVLFGSYYVLTVLMKRRYILSGKDSK